MLPPATDIKPTFLHRAPAGTKLAVALILIVFIALLPRRLELLYILPACLLALLWIASQMPLRYTVRRLLVAEFFILGIAGLSLLAPQAFPLFLSALVKSNLCVLTMVVLGWTTPFHEIVAVLRRLRAPFIMVTTLALLHRYLPVLRDESRRMQRAIASRTFSPAKRSQWKTISSIAGQLFIRSADRAERIYMAMCARGWK